ncbi:MAG: general secretion pathway protein GspK, partial [Candidatus Omnitrophica bacterium]|nr:general secretion pathway protein GspK [Candidatus Omnitrophota bacterium]
MILISIAVSLGRGANVELSLIKHSLGKIQSKYFAWAGLIFAIEQIRADSLDEESKGYDTLYLCGIGAANDRGPRELFESQNIGKGTFSISFQEDDNIRYGFRDEERFLNLNGLTRDNIKVFIELLNILGFDDVEAKTIGYSVLDWIDDDNEVSDDVYGAEDDYYQGLSMSYNTKNLPLDSKEELLLVRGMTGEIYKKLKEYITVYPSGKQLGINFNTADEKVLRALARSMAGPATNTTITDADNMVNKILDYRLGSDGQAFTKDDESVDMNEIPFSAPERVLFLVIKQYQKEASSFFRVQVEGRENVRNIKTRIEAVID